jgi:hypothetical protein
VAHQIQCLKPSGSKTERLSSDLLMLEWNHWRDCSLHLCLLLDELDMQPVKFVLKMFDTISDHISRTPKFLSSAIATLIAPQVPFAISFVPRSHPLSRSGLKPWWSFLARVRIQDAVRSSWTHPLLAFTSRIASAAQSAK